MGKYLGKVLICIFDCIPISLPVPFKVKLIDLLGNMGHITNVNKSVKMSVHKIIKSKP